jgi:hypothetical protein
MPLPTLVLACAFPRWLHCRSCFTAPGTRAFLILLIASIVLNWLAAQSFAATKSVAIIVAAIAGNLLVLFLFKYAIFFIDNIEALFNLPITRLSVILPLGISFFTFHHIMYLVDLRRGRAQLCSLPHYALYICFFPQAIAGPLSRWSEVGRQYGKQAFAAGWEPRFARGVLYIVIGLVEKTLLADTLGRALDPIYANAANGPVNDGSAWYALAFGFQVFFDFSGYSDIAIGLGLLFGIELPENFNAPFHAASILQLWQRWHMTLSRFSARLCVRAAVGPAFGGISTHSGALYGRDFDHHGAVRLVARRRMELCALGRAARLGDCLGYRVAAVLSVARPVVRLVPDGRFLSADRSAVPRRQPGRSVAHLSGTFCRSEREADHRDGGHLLPRGVGFAVHARTGRTPRLKAAAGCGRSRGHRNRGRASANRR